MNEMYCKKLLVVEIRETPHVDNLPAGHWLWASLLHLADCSVLPGIIKRKTRETQLKFIVKFIFHFMAARLCCLWKTIRVGASLNLIHPETKSNPSNRKSAQRKATTIQESHSYLSINNNPHDKRVIFQRSGSMFLQNSPCSIFQISWTLFTNEEAKQPQHPQTIALILFPSTLTTLATSRPQRLSEN